MNGTEWRTLGAMKNPRFLWEFCAALALAASPGCAAGASARLFPQAATSAQRPAAMDAQAWFQKGQAALTRGDLAAAEEAFHKVLDADPKAGAAYANLGVIAMRRKQWDDALRYLRRAGKLS